MLCYKGAQKRRLKYLVRQASVASADDRMEHEMFSRHCLVISNDPGGGEQDTAMTRSRWEQRYAKQPANQNDRDDESLERAEQEEERDKNQERHVKFDLSKTSYKSDESIGEPENISLVALRERTSSPTIEAVLEDRVRMADEQYRNLDAIREYEEEGACSEASSLSDICAEVEGEEYTVDHLMKAGPQFAQFVSLLESIVEEEEELNDDGGSEIAHSGMTQATPLTTTQATAEFPYF